MRYRLLVDAAEELENAAEYYEKSSRGLGVDFLDEFERAADLVCGMAEAWSPVDEHFRRFLMRRFPYAIIYRIDGDIVVVTSVFHQRRRPDSWRRNR